MMFTRLSRWSLQVQVTILSCVAIIVARLRARLAMAEGGQSMVEYALVVAFVAVAGMVVVKLFGEALSGVFNRLIEKLKGVG